RKTPPHEPLSRNKHASGAYLKRKTSGASTHSPSLPSEAARICPETDPAPPLHHKLPLKRTKYTYSASADGVSLKTTRGKICRFGGDIGAIASHESSRNKV